MSNISVTTIIGLAKVGLIITIGIFLLLGKIDIPHAAIVLAFIGQALSSVGLMKAQDAPSPKEPHKTKNPLSKQETQ